MKPSQVSPRRKRRVQAGYSPHARVTGLFQARDRGGIVQPFDSAAAGPIEVPAPFRFGAEHGQAVVVEVMPPFGRRGAAQGKVLEILGRLSQAGTEIAILTRKYGLRSDFPREVLTQAAELPQRVGRSEVSRRQRFDDPPPVTIDGETARDFDDAIAVKQLRNGFRLWVHIADVGHFVPPGSALDLEARERGTSVYFPNTVLPMFPERISNDLCSLRPGVDRLVQSVILDLSVDAELRRIRFADGVIRSAARLTYTQVAETLAGSDRVRGVPPRLVPMLRAADGLREALERSRRQRGSIDFDLPEPQVLLDVEGVMTGIRIEPRNRAHRLIEECMLIANEAVASEMERRSRGCMYRIHEPPERDRLATLESFARSFAPDLPALSEPVDPGAIGRLIAAFDGKPAQTVIQQVALRTMNRASYSMQNVGHFGLAASAYCHFTSPIRRYPDLVVHRLLRAARRRQRENPAEEKALAAIAKSSSERERMAEAAERELLLWKKVEFISRHVGKVFAGRITGVTAFGLFIQIEDNLVEGLLHVERLGGERFEFRESLQLLQGTRTGTTYRLGDRVEVHVDRVDRVLQRVDFSLPGSAGKAERKAPRRVAEVGRKTGRRGPSRRRGSRRR